MNGKAEWFYRLGTAVLAAVLAYAALSSRVSVIESREQSHFEEVQRTLQRIERTVERLDQRP